MAKKENADAVFTHYMVDGFPQTAIEVAANDHIHEVRFKDGRKLTIPFQVGDPRSGINGVTIEALLASASHRLQQHQDGDHPCIENAAARTCIEDAIKHLKTRFDRVTREEVAAAKAAAEPVTKAAPETTKKLASTTPTTGDKPAEKKPAVD